VQIVLLVLEMAYTATRPAALVYVRRNEKRAKDPCIGEDDSDEDEEDNKERDDGKGDEDSDWGEEHDKTLCYGDVTLLLLPNPDGIRDVLAMEVDAKRGGWTRVLLIALIVLLIIAGLAVGLGVGLTRSKGSPSSPTAASSPSLSSSRPETGRKGGVLA
jgi:Protein of unknown function (DUF3435)